ncbi:tetratricopeptide repeat protein [Lysobacter koreensis]|uniref:Tetratricopeptide repeat protein n=1 Tax=Lysobacter koreensis TaxID=266122 RepID=A0ABW2YMY0_9GAMM
MNFAALGEGFAALQLLRPQWLWALLALPMLAWLWRARRRHASVWRDTVDAHLLPHLLDTAPHPRARLAWWGAALGYGLAVLALAGPSWRHVEQPLWQSHAPLVVALDLSSATMAADLPPSRLAQARAKLSTLLRERAGGQVGLVVYAGDAFTVAPLTDDAANVALFLDSLLPDVMPVDGQRGDRAIAWSAKLLRQAGFKHGDILLLTDHADDAAQAAAANAAGDGYRVSALGLGSEAGAPYQRPDGSVAGARLDPASLRALAKRGGGRYAALAPGDADLRTLRVLDPTATEGAAAQGETGTARQDGGFWLLPPLMLIALFAFRRGGAVAVLLVCLWLPWHSVHAADLWRRPDQAAHARMQRGEQAYRRGDFARAAQLYGEVDSADAHYNRGNALAKAGQYPQAIDAYDQALQQQPQMADALANRRAVKAVMDRKPPKGPKQDQGDPNPKADASKNGKPSTQGGKGEAKAPPQPPSPDQSRSEDPASERDPGKQQKPASAAAQQAADAAQRERMQRELQQAKAQPDAKPPTDTPTAPPRETPAQRERRLANEAWLKRVPDDPGGLLREKFRIEHERRQLQGLQGE